MATATKTNPWSGAAVPVSAVDPAATTAPQWSGAPMSAAPVGTFQSTAPAAPAPRSCGCKDRKKKMLASAGFFVAGAVAYRVLWGR